MNPLFKSVCIFGLSHWVCLDRSQSDLHIWTLQLCCFKKLSGCTVIMCVCLFSSPAHLAFNPCLCSFRCMLVLQDYFTFCMHCTLYIFKPPRCCWEAPQHCGAATTMLQGGDCVYVLICTVCCPPWPKSSIYVPSIQKNILPLTLESPKWRLPFALSPSPKAFTYTIYKAILMESMLFLGTVKNYYLKQPTKYPAYLGVGAREASIPAMVQ